jgi:5'-nucleotidase/UDP-sugar diphosphatase
MRRLSIILTVLALGAGWLFAATPSTGAPDAQYNITILHINDYHGHLLPFNWEGAERGGLARIASIVDAIRKENAERRAITLFLVAGDVLTGSRLSNYFKGEADIMGLNLIKPDAACFGNHEFDYGLANLHHLMDISTFPWVCANVADAGGKNLTKGSVLLDETLGGKEYKIAIFGLVTPDTPKVTSDPAVSALSFADPAAAAKKMMEQYNGKNAPIPDLMIALTHIGYADDCALAKAVSGINVIVGGHSHTLLSAPTVEGNTVVVTAHEYGKWVGRLDMELKKGEKPKLVAWQLLPVTKDWADDAAVKAVIDSYAAKQGQIADRVLCKSTTVLVGNNSAVRNGEATLGDLVADLLRERVKTDIALVNAGTFRNDLGPGDIKLLDLMDALPFDNNIATLKLSGSALMTALERSIAGKGEGPFLQVSGMTVVYDGGKVADVKIGGAPLEPDKTYTVATSTFLAAGKDGYDVLLAEGKDKVDTGLPFNDVVVDGMSKLGTIDYKNDGRITIK